MKKQTSKDVRRDARIGEPRLLTLKEASELTGLTIWCLRERIWRGELPFVRFPNGRKQYIRIKDLERCFKQNLNRVE